jgi:glycosyltransferase involved in cell wall biosynthesis
MHHANKLRVLLLTAVYPPRGGSCVQRVYYFSEHLSELGHDVWVVTEDTKSLWVSDSQMPPVTVPDTHILRIPIYANRYVAGIMRILSKLTGCVVYPDSYTPWAIKAFNTALKLIDQYGIDYLIVNLGHPSALWCAWRLKKARPGLVLHVDIQDTWAGNPVAFQGRHHRWPLASINRSLEKKFFAAADKITVIERTMAADVAKRHPDSADQLTVLPHGYDSDIFRSASSVASSGTPCVFRYLGFINEDMRVDNLFSAVSRLRRQDEDHVRDVEFEFVGGSPKFVRDLAREYGIEDLVSVRDYVEHDQAIQLMLDADVLLLFWTSDPGCICGKLYEYLRADRFILASAQKNPDGQRIITESKRGKWVDAFDIESQMALIKLLVSKKQNDKPLLLDELPDIGHLDRRSIAKQLSNLIQNSVIVQNSVIADELSPVA